MLYAKVKVMNRNIQINGIILKAGVTGDIHKNLWILTPGRGIIKATAFGAVKGKLRAVTNPFTSGKFYFYYNPTKDQYKLTDVGSARGAEPLLKNLTAYYTASLCAEVILKSYAAGLSGGELFALVKDAFSLLQSNEHDRLHEDNVMYVLIHFIWRFLCISGLRPDPYECMACGKKIADNETVYYSCIESGFLCNVCSPDEDNPLMPGARRFIIKSENLSLRDATRIKLDETALQQLKKTMLTVIQEAMETPLNTLKTGKGILI